MSEIADLTAAQRDLRAPRAAGVAGLAFSLFFTLGLALIRSQALVGMSEAEVSDWFQSGGKTIVLVGLYCIPVAGIAFLWFIAVVRDRFGEREDRFFATVFFGSGLLFAACVFGAAALVGSLVLGAPGQTLEVPSRDMIELASAQGYALLFVFGTKLGAVFLVSTATLARRLALFGRWLPRLGYAFALALLLVVGVVDWVILLLPLWVTLLSIEILRRPVPPEARTG